MQNINLYIYADGGSRGNPGRAACAFVVNQNSVEIFKESKYLGIQTNNFAEYSGVILALEWLLANKPTISKTELVTFFLDSELVVKQINGLYKVKDTTLKILFNKITSLLSQISSDVKFKNVPREENKRADYLVNEELDSRI